MQPSNSHYEFDALNPAHKKWDEMDGDKQQAAAVLGYSPETWNPENWAQGQLVVTSLLKDKSWQDLDETKQDAAKKVGLSPEKWGQVHSILNQQS